MISL
ncbi:unnamed protein product [Rhodiola kirilowii]|jgi:hypothetical protein